MFFGALDEMATNWILSRRRYPLAEQADEIVDILVGGFGVIVHMGTLLLAHEVLKLDFVWAQTLATIIAMTFNFVLNNELTYANKKLRGWRYLTGMLSFYVVCSIGALANVSVASWIYTLDRDIWIAGIAGVLMSVVFNYSVTKVFTCRIRAPSTPNFPPGCC